MPQLPYALTRAARAVSAALVIGVVWVPATSAPAGAAALPTLGFVFMTPADPATHELQSPLGLAYDANNERLYVADTGHNRVVVYNRNGRMLSSFRHWVRYFDGTRMLGEPWRLLPGDRGTMLVADRLSDRIDVVDIFGATVDSIDVTAALGGKERASPGTMARDAAGNLYLLNDASGQVVVLDRAGRLLRSFGPRSQADARFQSLAGMAVAPDGTTYVLDRAEDVVVQVFDPAGRPLGGFGKHGEKSPDFHMPAAIALDKSDRLWIADAFSHEVKVYSTAGEFLAVLGQMGVGPGDLYFPSDVAVTPDTLYVLERAGARVQAFRISDP